MIMDSNDVSKLQEVLAILDNNTLESQQDPNLDPVDYWRNRALEQEFGYEEIKFKCMTLLHSVIRNVNSKNEMSDQLDDDSHSRDSFGSGRKDDALSEGYEKKRAPVRRRAAKVVKSMSVKSVAEKDDDDTDSYESVGKTVRMISSSSGRSISPNTNTSATATASVTINNATSTPKATREKRRKSLIRRNSVNDAKKKIVHDMIPISNTALGKFVSSSVPVNYEIREILDIEERREGDIILSSESNLYFEMGKRWKPDYYHNNIIPDVYSRIFIEREHHCFILSNNRETSIICVLDDPDPAGYRGLKIKKEGFEEFVIPTQEEKLNHLKFLENHFPMQEIFKLNQTEDLVQSIADIEKSHRQKPKSGRIGLILVDEGQVNPLEMFENETCEEFENFLSIMEIDTNELLDKTNNIFTKTKYLRMSWHIAPFQNKEEHRRLIGNDTCIILFLKEGISPFDPIEISKLGLVPQFFVVVQPVEGRYRVGYFSQHTLRPFHPFVPNGYLFEEEELKNFLHIKIFNGYMMTMYCPPLNRLFVMPRKRVIEEIAIKYAKGYDKKSRKKSEKKSKQKS